ncbi:MAG: endonuclease/exonuclease/phosphatase family protein [Planctomycetes bacterium]|nr:endonuclease/exonuclease/phosphatase family protein [Planctomycetota bacterium]
MRLLSYNIHKGIGGRDRKYQIQRIIDVIEEENPDLICLQEVDREVHRSRNHDQPRLLAEYFNATEKLFQLNVRLKNGGYGNLLLSRWALRSHHQISLRMNRKKHRGAQIAVVETPEGLLHLVNWHLGLADRERHWQVNHLFDHHLFRESEHLPTMVVGDFNDWDSTATPLEPSSAGDIWVVTVPLDPGRYQYTFLVDGEQWVADPGAPRALQSDFGWPSSVITVPEI